MECKRILSVLLTILTILCTSCEKECCCAPGCTRCGDCWCQCCGNERVQAFVLSLCHDDGTEASSYHVDFNGMTRDFYGCSTIFHTNVLQARVIAYNNDTEKVFVKNGIATTMNENGIDSLSHMPDPFYCYVAETAITADTLSLTLSKRVYDYNIHVVLENNDGRVIGCPFIVMNGLARGNAILTDTLVGVTAHRTTATMSHDRITAKVNSWGKSGDSQALTLYLRQPHGLSVYHCDVSMQTVQQPRGGDILVTINVSKEIETIPEGGNGGVSIDLGEWESHDVFIEV